LTASGDAVSLTSPRGFEQGIWMQALTGLDARPIAVASIAVAVAVLVLKGIAAWLSGSVALLSDAIESIVNVVTASAALAAIIYARRPPDANHPYGHEKAEYFVSLLVALLIGAAAWSILERAWDAWKVGKVLAPPASAYAANIAAGLLNGAWCYVLVSRGRALRSTALESDGWHLFSDVLSSAGVLAGVFLAQVTGLYWFDPLLAALVSLNILWSGYQLLKSSVAGLMDMAPDKPTMDAISRAIAVSGAGALQAHDIRARSSARSTFIEFHLVVAGSMRVDESHALCDRIETALRRDIPGAQVTIHVEPEEKAHPAGGLDIDGMA
jgi:cation diffusion facilitator family transporter